MNTQATREIVLRPGNPADLPGVNAVIESAVMGWDLPERVKRLALSSYLYQQHDLAHIQLWVAEANGDIVGVASLEPAESRELPDNRQGLLLHGLYVHPDFQQRGIGTRLLQVAEQQVREQDLDGLLVRAQSGAGRFFANSGLQLLPAREAQDYQNRYWKPINS